METMLGYKYIEELIDTRRQLLELAEKSKTNGVLSLESDIDEIKNQHPTCEINDLLVVGVEMCVRGYEVSIIDKVLSNKIKNIDGRFECTKSLMIKEGILLIANEYNPDIVKLVIDSCIPFMWLKQMEHETGSEINEKSNN